METSVGRASRWNALRWSPSAALVQLLSEQLQDGGWNCEASKSPRSSFHTTICVLEGLLEYERAGRKSSAVTEARKRAEKLAARAPRLPRQIRTAQPRCRISG